LGKNGRAIQLNGYSQTGCSFQGNFADFRRNIGVLIGGLLGAVCGRRERLALFSCEFALCLSKAVASFLGKLLFKLKL